MYIGRIALDDQAAADGELVVERPGLSDVRAIFAKLDGRRHTLLTLEAPTGPAHMGIGGGAGDRYVVYATMDNERFRMLRGDAAPGALVMVRAGGQDGEYPSEQVVSGAKALAAAEAFAERGMLTETLGWVGDLGE